MTATTLGNRLLSALLALALLLGGLLVATEIVLAQIGRPAWLIPHQQWADWLTEQTWDDGISRLVLAGMAIVGLILLILALRRGRPRLIPVASEAAGVEVSVQRRGAERAVASAARQASGVRGASASITRRAVRVTARTEVRSADDVRHDTTTAVTGRLADLGLDRLRPRIRVKGHRS